MIDVHQWSHGFMWKWCYTNYNLSYQMLWKELWNLSYMHVTLMFSLWFMSSWFEIWCICYKLLTWLSAGGILAHERSSSSFLQEKLLTPMALVRPRFWHSSMPSQTDLISKGNACSFTMGAWRTSWLNFNGQCIKYISR